MLNYVYPAIFTPAVEGGYDVYIPDFDINTQGDDLPDAIVMARDAIGMCGVYREDEKQELPKPTSLKDHQVSVDQILTLVDIDFMEYRKKHDNRTERRNIAIPRWLNSLAKEKSINVSEIATEAIKKHLGV